MIFCIAKDEDKKISAEEEKKRPVVNGVGFWFNDDHRNIIHINEYQALNVCFYFLKKPMVNS